MLHLLRRAARRRNMADATTSQTNRTKTKRMTDALVEKIADGLTFLAVGVGVLAWWFAREDASRKSDALDKYKSDSAERTAALQNETALARLELAKIDPLNLPIRSMSAQVFIVVRGKFFENQFTELGGISVGKMSSSVSLYDREGALVTLRCSAFESMPAFTGHDTKISEPDGRTFSMSFVWPSSEWIDAQTVYKYWVERANASTAMLDKVMVAADIATLGSETDMEIITSSFVVTINGSIQRKFTVPKTAKAGGIILCRPETPNPITSTAISASPTPTSSPSDPK